MDNRSVSELWNEWAGITDAAARNIHVYVNTMLNQLGKEAADEEEREVLEAVEKASLVVEDAWAELRSLRDLVYRLWEERTA